MKAIKTINVFLRLIKYKVSATVAFTTIPGYLLIDHKIDLTLLLIVIGVYFLASAATTLNQIQEFRYDSLMDRTRSRPLPSGDLELPSAVFIASVLLFIGSYILFVYGGWIPLLLGLFNIFWYNGVYTYLKRITPFAVVPGSLIGAIPPLIGWTAAGGPMLSSTILMLGFFLFIWQVPHFWLLMIRYDADYRMAGYPVLTERLSQKQIKKITGVWILATVASMCLFPLYGIVHHIIACLGVFLIGFILFIWAVFILLNPKKEGNEMHSFVLINVGMVLTMLVIILENLLT